MMVENTTNRARAYALGGDDALEDVVFVATSRRARVVCVETYAPADEASPGRASAFSAATRRDAARVCPSPTRSRRGARHRVRAVAARAYVSRVVPWRRRAVRPSRATPSGSPPSSTKRFEDLFGAASDRTMTSRPEVSIPSVRWNSRRRSSDDSPSTARSTRRRSRRFRAARVIAFWATSPARRRRRDRREPPPRDLTATTRDARVKCLKSSTSAPSLFLGAPAFGDGQLAYMKLARARTRRASRARRARRRGGTVAESLHRTRRGDRASTG